MQVPQSSHYVKAKMMPKETFGYRRETRQVILYQIAGLQLLNPGKNLLQQGGTEKTNGQYWLFEWIISFQTPIQMLQDRTL